MKETSWVNSLSGKKKQIAILLLEDEKPSEIAIEVGTTENYVLKTRSQFRAKGYLPRKEAQPHVGALQHKTQAPSLDDASSKISSASDIGHIALDQREVRTYANMEPEAFILFEEGKDPIDVVKIKKIPADWAIRMHSNYLKMKGMDSVLHVYKELGEHKFETFNRIYKRMTEDMMDPDDYVFALKDGAELPRMQEEFNKLRKDYFEAKAQYSSELDLLKKDLQMKEMMQHKSEQILSRLQGDVLSYQKKKDGLILDVDRIQGKLANLYNKEYLSRLRECAIEIMKDLDALAMIAVFSAIESIKRDPEGIIVLSGLDGSQLAPSERLRLKEIVRDRIVRMTKNAYADFCIEVMRRSIEETEKNLKALDNVNLNPKL